MGPWQRAWLKEQRGPLIPLTRPLGQGTICRNLPSSHALLCRRTGGWKISILSAQLPSWSSHVSVETGFFYDCITNSSCDPTVSKQKPLLVWEMATDSSILAWKFPGTGEPGGPWSTGSQRVGHDWGMGTQAIKGPSAWGSAWLGKTGGGILGRWLLSFWGNMAFCSVQFSPSVVSHSATPWTTVGTPGLPVHNQLPGLAQTHVCWVGDAIQASHPLSLTPKNWPFWPAPRVILMQVLQRFSLPIPQLQTPVPSRIPRLNPPLSVNERSCKRSTGSWECSLGCGPSVHLENPPPPPHPTPHTPPENNLPAGVMVPEA